MEKDILGRENGLSKNDRGAKLLKTLKTLKEKQIV